MSIKFSIANGTPKSGPSLCKTCRRAVIIEGQNCEEVVKCQELGEFVKFRVAKCGKYHPSNMPWLHEMEQMAWLVQARKRGRSGFAGEPVDNSLEVTIESPKKNQDAGLPSDLE